MIRGLLPALLLTTVAARGEVLLEETFATPTDAAPFRHLWGDRPEEVLRNEVRDGQAKLVLRFPADPAQRPNKLSYWAWKPPTPVPLFDGLERIRIELAASLPVQLKVGLSPFGFIYHAPVATKGPEPQELLLEDARTALGNWVRGGKQDPALGYLGELILAIDTRPGHEAEVTVTRIALEGPAGAGDAMRREALRREVADIKIAAVSLPWDEAQRTLPVVLQQVSQAAGLGADLVLLPQECLTTTEPIPGPSSDALTAAAKEHGIYLIANYRERDGDATYVTSLLCGPDGEIVGKYRKSHKLPDEDLTLGDELPVFPTRFGPIAMKIGSDRYFPEIDHCYAAQGARLIGWSQRPEPLEDEHLQDTPIPGLAIDYRVSYAVARYAPADGRYITDFAPTYLGMPIGRSYVVNREGQRVASTPRTGGIALASLPLKDLAAPRGRPSVAGFEALTVPTAVPPKPEYAKRRVKLAAIDGHLPIDTLCERLDELGAEGCDLACTYEYVWLPIRSDATEAQQAEARERAAEWRARVAAKAKEHRMYVLLAGVVDTMEKNEAILYDRNGDEVWRFLKIARTYDEQILGSEVPYYDTDFGRFGVWICADEIHLEIPRVLHVLGADIVFTPTQSWGPDATHRDHRDIARAMLNGLFLVEATHISSEPNHRSKIIDPTGTIVAQSAYRDAGWCLATVDLDAHRPRRYAREWTPREVKGYLPEFQTDRVPAETNDLFDVIRAQRRPELYRVILWPEPAAATH